MCLVPFALTGKTTAFCLRSLFLISELLPQTRHCTSAIWDPFHPCCNELSVQFVLTAQCTEAKSKELVIWAPTVVMRHLQCNRPNQIFGCASFRCDISYCHCGTGRGAEPAWGRGTRGGWGQGGKSPPPAPSSCSISCPLSFWVSSEAAAPLGQGPKGMKRTTNSRKAHLSEVTFSFSSKDLIKLIN